MAIKDILEKMGGKNKETKERFRELMNEDRMMEKINEMKKSSNERLLERDLKELREKKIKQQVELLEKKRNTEFIHGHKILETPNIIKKQKGSWELMKEPNLFNHKKNLFTHQKNVIKGNPNLMNNGKLGLVRC